MDANSISTNSTAIVTGASRGIGRAIAFGLGGAGHDVTINYHANRPAAEEAADEVRDAGGQPLVVQADIGKADDRQRLVQETLARFGSIDLLVNNAGVAPKERADLLDMGEASWDHVMGTNLKGPFFLSQAVARHMIEAEASNAAIINIGSMSAYTASINRGEYCIAKAGMAMMTKLLAVRLAIHDINVYELRPGIIETDMTGPVKTKYDRMIHDEGLTPLRRWGQPADVAAAVLAVAEGRLPYSTGEVINVDGGFHLRVL